MIITEETMKINSMWITILNNIKKPPLVYMEARIEAPPTGGREEELSVNSMLTSEA